MKTIARIAAVCVGILAFSSAVQAEDLQKDPLFQGRTMEVSFGLFAPLNTLQDTLTTQRRTRVQVQSTNLLDFGVGGRINVTYSNPISQDSRVVLSFTGARAAANARINIGAADETFNGIYGSGFRLPANSYFDSTVDTRSAMVSVGKEWTRGSTWRFSAGVQGGSASQDISTRLYGRVPLALFNGELFSTIDVKSKNYFAGVYGGVSHYTALGDGLGLRLSGNLGVMRHAFDFEYTRVNRALFTLPNSQRLTASDVGATISTKISARLERSLEGGAMVTMEVGYDGLYGLGNGVDTFLDFDGSSDFADIESDAIGAAYLSVGYTIRY